MIKRYIWWNKWRQMTWPIIIWIILAAICWLPQSLWGVDAPTTVVVDGNVTRIAGLTDVEGVEVCAYHTATKPGKYPVDTVGGAKIILPLAACDAVDTSGYFKIYVIKSSNYTDTSWGFYTFEAKFGGQTMWKIENLYLVDSINLGDSFVVR